MKITLFPDKTSYPPNGWLQLIVKNSFCRFDNNYKNIGKSTNYSKKPLTAFRIDIFVLYLMRNGITGNNMAM
ncbi:MAG: hypothetical protein KDH97_15250, partial [Calditrichaeota bacterium]|nr:hypothetical protein [Calditrichota bacterium]